MYESKLLWMNGPFPASTPDITIYKNHGLKAAMPAGKKTVGNKGYRGDPDVIFTPNPHDTVLVRKFKSQVHSCHKTFNACLKNFAALSGCFCHDISKHKAAFEAACVICQYQLETGSQLFDV